MGGYRLVTPQGWRRVTTGRGTEESQKAFVADSIRALSGREHVLAERALSARLARIVSGAENAGALELYAYSRRFGDVLVTMDFSLGVVYLGPAIDALGVDGVVELQERGGGEVSVLELDHLGLVVRTLERVVQSPDEFRASAERVLGSTTDAAAGDAEADRTVESAIATLENDGVVIRKVRVSYLVPIPDAPGSFLLATCNADEGALDAALVYHFDAIMETLRWT